MINPTCQLHLTSEWLTFTRSPVGTTLTASGIGCICYMWFLWHLCFSYSITHFIIIDGKWQNFGLKHLDSFVGICILPCITCISLCHANIHLAEAAAVSFVNKNTWMMSVCSRCGCHDRRTWSVTPSFGYQQTYALLCYNCSVLCVIIPLREHISK